MGKILKLLLIFFFYLSFFGCKEKTNEVKNTQQPLDKTTIDFVKNEESKKITNHTLNDFQGIWVSYSYYLEHEQEFKDFNEHQYYKIVLGKTVLELKVTDGILNNNIRMYDFGFLDVSDKSLFATKEDFLKNLKTSGNTLVRLERNNKTYNASDIEISTDFTHDYELGEIINEGFKYDSKTHQFNFRILTSLQKEVFIKLKERSIIDNIDYLEKFKLFQISEKGKIKVAKTFFHNDTIKKTKRKAFLIKGDLVYIEEMEDNWLKVYYDSKTVSGGYIQKSNVEVLEK